jgi:hypothetical protein
MRRLRALASKRGQSRLAQANWGKLTGNGTRKRTGKRDGEGLDRGTVSALTSSRLTRCGRR